MRAIAAGAVRPPYDLAIIGGGINGCGIARDAVGRGWSVFLCEKGDLAGATSSAASKLIHGGLRYLEYYQFRLVREALLERETLWRIAPHIIWPLRFVLPHHKGLRPAWLLRLGLFLYDHLGARKLLPATRTLRLRDNPAGAPLKPEYTIGFEYSDCWVEDSRLVVLNARDAANRGASIAPRTACVAATREGGLWRLTLRDEITGETGQISARALVNAAGPWVGDVLGSVVGVNAPASVRLVKGSHIVTERLFQHDRCYIFQNNDGRIFFAIPYEREFTLIGTTDLDYSGDPGAVSASEAEIEYLCAAASDYFRKPVTKSLVRWSYSGVRPLFDDGATAAQSATRDYVLKIDAQDNAPALLNVYGGKITTYRKLAESALAMLAAHLPAPGRPRPWTASAPLPGGDFPVQGFETLVADLQARYRALDGALVRRLARAYGSLAPEILKGLDGSGDLGRRFGAGLSEAELNYLAEREWAMTGEDVVWRRSKLGLRLSAAEIDEIDAFMRTASALETAAVEDDGIGRVTLALDKIGLEVDGVTVIHDVSLTLEAGSLNVLLGPTLAGKTTIMRLMAGLDRPTSGRLWLDGRDVTGVSVRQRSIAMVYQQFVNYPSLSVYENIASPLRVARLPRSEIESRVVEAARVLRLENLLKRMPSQLSGGQQQRTAIARALVKRAGLVLLDEPLANLDYKLREELREELPRIFSRTGAILVYATTEPSEALLLGGSTITLSEGRVTQVGPTSRVYRDPMNIDSARVFSDPPLNELTVTKQGPIVSRSGGQSLGGVEALRDRPNGDYRLAFRADAASIGPPRAGALNFPGKVLVTEISGSESFVHVDVGSGAWVCLVPGVHDFAPGDVVSVNIDASGVLAFDASGQRVAASQTIEPNAIARQEATP